MVTPSKMFSASVATAFFQPECEDVNGDSAFFFFPISVSASEKIKTDCKIDHLFK